MKNIAEAREKVYQLFGSDGVNHFDNAINSNENKLVIYYDEVRVVLINQEGNPVFIFGERLNESDDLNFLTRL